MKLRVLTMVFALALVALGAEPAAALQICRPTSTDPILSDWTVNTRVRYRVADGCQGPVVQAEAEVTIPAASECLTVNLAGAASDATFMGTGKTRCSIAYAIDPLFPQSAEVTASRHFPGRGKPPVVRDP